MLFNSYMFLLFFFPVTWFTYFFLNRYHKETLAKIALLGFSFWFYGYYLLEYLGILICSIVLNFSFTRGMKKFCSRRRMFLLLGLFTNVGILFWFKYFNFFINNVNTICKTTFSDLHIIMPLGISFFTFQQISYIVDSYKEDLDYSFLDYALYVSFFPQLIAGPIVLHSELIPQFREESRKRVDFTYLAEGLYRFSKGLAKKVLLADTIAGAVDWGYNHYELLTGPNLVLLAVFYSFQLYFDFSGYCDMACGIAKCFHLDLPENFNSPFKADSISDLWRRWHMTLGRFLTTYIYIPLGGSRKGLVRTCINTLIVFLVSGIWHGANWTFVVWGLMHGIGLVLYRVFAKIWDKLYKPIKVAATYGFFCLSFIFFRADSLKTATTIIRRIFTDMTWSLQENFYKAFDVVDVTYIEEHIPVLRGVLERYPATNMWLLLMLSFFICFFTKNSIERKNPITVKSAVWASALFCWSVTSLAKVATFLYFNF